MTKISETDLDRLEQYLNAPERTNSTLPLDMVQGLLAAVASVLIVVFNGDISALIPLYAFGVFTGFTLSQSGMVRHHLKHREGNWRASLAINGIGAASTGLIAVIVVVSKFTEGAWIPAALIPIMVLAFRAIGKHYKMSRGAVVAQPVR